MKRTSLALGMMVAVWSSSAFAQNLRLGIDAVGMVPVGNFSNAYGIGLGGLLRLEVSPVPGFAITGRSGYIQHLTKTIASITGTGSGVDTKLGEVPILAGAKFYTGSGLYGALEAGGTYLNPSISGSGTGLSYSTSSFYPSASAGIGVVAGPVDIGARLHSVDLGHVSDTLQIGLSVGFNFLSL